MRGKVASFFTWGSRLREFWQENLHKNSGLRYNLIFHYMGLLPKSDFSIYRRETEAQRGYVITIIQFQVTGFKISADQAIKTHMRRSLYWWTGCPCLSSQHPPWEESPPTDGWPLCKCFPSLYEQVLGQWLSVFPRQAPRRKTETRGGGAEQKPKRNFMPVSPAFDKYFHKFLYRATDTWGNTGKQKDSAKLCSLSPAHSEELSINWSPSFGLPEAHP
jgi:hypothetical protein